MAKSSLIEENKQKEGYGSWYYTQPGNLDLQSKEKCNLRLSSLGLKRGQKVRVQIVGGADTRNYTGVVERVQIPKEVKSSFDNAFLFLKQNKSTKIIQACSIDEVTILE